MTESVSKAGYLEAMPVRNLTTKTGVRRDFPMEGDIQMVIMKIGLIRPANPDFGHVYSSAKCENPFGQMESIVRRRKWSLWPRQLSSFPLSSPFLFFSFHR